MRAIVFKRYGTPDVLQIKDVNRPEPKNDEVLVKIRATAVNDWDWCFVRGKPYIYRLMSYCQIWCMPRKSSGDLVGLFDLFSVNKCHAFNDLCQVFEAA